MNSSLFSDILELVTPALPPQLSLPAQLVSLVVRDAEAREWHVDPTGTNEASGVAAGRAASREAALAGLPDAVARVLRTYGLREDAIAECTAAMVRILRARWPQ